MKYDKTKKILLIEMTKELSSAFSIECKNSDYSFISVYSEKSAFDSLLMTSFHAALLHMQSRNDHTLSLCNTLRKKYNFPILILSRFDDINTKVSAFEAGANDYIVKPFSLHELFARIKNLITIWNGNINTEAEIPCGNLSLNPCTKTTCFFDTHVFLTCKEFYLLHYFMIHPNIILTRSHLIHSVWDPALISTSNIVDVTVGKIRKKLNAVNEFNNLQTIRGMGYIFKM